jgi:predicted CXXCH cytochrome family protein
MFKKLVGLLTIAVAGLVLGGVASAQGITNSEHDFSANGYSGGEICIVCHNTHNTDTTVSDAPLWNHDVTAAGFTPYTSSTLDASDVGQPGGQSKLCLSCHDGTVAIDSFGGATGTNYVAGNMQVGIDLTDDHPISFTYSTGFADPDLFDPTVAASGLPGGGNVNEDMLFGPGNDQVECSSCHNVHDDTFGAFLVKSNAGSALCLTCHDK